MKTVLFIMLGLMASVGLGYVLLMLQRWILRPGAAAGVAAVLPVFAEEKDVEQRLRSVYTDLLAGAYGGNPALLIVNLGADEETLRICEAFCGESKLARMCELEALESELRGLQT